jgi:hypothetical protein
MKCSDCGKFSGSDYCEACLPKHEAMSAAVKSWPERLAEIQKDLKPIPKTTCEWEGCGDAAEFLTIANGVDYLTCPGCSNFLVERTHLGGGNAFSVPLERSKS